MISKDLFLSILAMDAYNQRYDEGIIHGSDRIGDALVNRQSEILPESNQVGDDFYALTYNVDGSDIDGWGNQTEVLSFRGTDSLVDTFRGWFIGAADIFRGTQAEHALEFYDAVAARRYQDGSDSNLVLTSHSIGTGLASAPFVPRYLSC